MNIYLNIPDRLIAELQTLAGLSCQEYDAQRVEALSGIIVQLLKEIVPIRLGELEETRAYRSLHDDQEEQYELDLREDEARADYEYAKAVAHANQLPPCERAAYLAGEGIQS